MLKVIKEKRLDMLKDTMRKKHQRGKNKISKKLIDSANNYQGYVSGIIIISYFEHSEALNYKLYSLMSYLR